MKVTPLDIRRKEFRRSVRGYLDEDVDVFLDTVADEVERIAKVNAELLVKVRELEEQVAGHAHIREALEKTLVAAQLQSDEIRSTAQKESQSMLREAEAKAKAVVDDFYAQTRKVQQTLIQLKLLEEDFRFKFKGLLEGYMKLVEDGPLVLSSPDVGIGATVAEEVQVEAVVARDVEEEREPERDDSPTSETMEAAGLLAEEAVTAQARQSAPATLPPHLPKTAPAPKPKQGGAPDGGVQFGRVESDPDDPFPEIGGDPLKPRDFEW